MVGEVSGKAFFAFFSVSSCDIRLGFHVLRIWDLSVVRGQRVKWVVSTVCVFLEIVRAVKANIVLRGVKAGGFAHVRRSG